MLRAPKSLSPPLSGCVGYWDTYKMCSAGGTSWRGLRTTALDFISIIQFKLCVWIIQNYDSTVHLHHHLNVHKSLCVAFYWFIHLLTFLENIFTGKYFYFAAILLYCIWMNEAFIFGYTFVHIFKYISKYFCRFCNNILMNIHENDS